METKKQKKKQTILIAVIATLAVAAVIGAIILLLNREKGYRVIKIFSLEGSATVTRSNMGKIEAYKNMLLESGDVVALDTGSMTLKLDDDKYVYVEEQTEFELEASGSSKKSKTKIKLNRGAITNEIQNKLNGESSYEINTQNSTMSVRGTIYRVEVYYDENGVLYTKVSVFDGSVAVRLVYPDGTVADEETTIDKSKEVIIYQNDETTDYLTGVRDIDYTALPDDVITLLIQLGVDIDEKASGSDAIKEPEESSEEADNTYTVTFLYESSVFGTQQVKSGDCAAEPVLMPEPSGGWDFDFKTPITKDTEIKWKQP